MVSPKAIKQHKCPTCGKDILPGALVCQSCHTILAQHSERPRTPAWAIILLLLIILALLGYIVYLGREILVLHRF